MCTSVCLDIKGSFWALAQKEPCIFSATHGSCVLQGVAVCYTVLQCLMQHTALVCCRVLQSATRCCGV